MLESGENKQVHLSVLVKRNRRSKWPALSYDDALKLIDEYFEKPREVKRIPVHMLREGLILAEDIVAVKQYPEFPTSTKDGYAVIASDGTGIREVINKTTAGTIVTAKVFPNTCWRVNTGAMVPEGADAVVPVEDTVLLKHDNVDELEINVLTAIKKGDNVRSIGSDVDIGTLLLEKNSILNPAEIGIIALSEVQIVSVFCSPTIAVLSTGNELVDSGANDCTLGLVRDTNRPQILALLRQNGFYSLDMGIVPDNEKKLAECLSNAFSIADVVVTSGGVSMGEKDFMKNILENRFHFQIHFGRVFMKPGLPTTFATGVFGGKEKAIFALPGNPVSTYVTANLFVLPAVKKLAGIKDNHWSILKARSTTDLKLESRPDFRPAWLYAASDGSIEVTASTEPESSSRLLATKHSNVILKLPSKTDSLTEIKRGRLVDAIVVGKI